MTDEGNFFCIPNAVVDDHLATLSGAAVKTYAILQRYHNRATGEAFPSYEHIQELAGLAPASVAKAVKELIAAGLLTVRKEGRRSFYRFSYCSGSVPEVVQKLKRTPQEPVRKLKSIGSETEVEPVRKLKSIKTKDQNEPIKTKGTPIVPYSSAFDRFWERWPAGGRKVDKAGAWRIWAKKGLDAQAAVVMEGLERWIGSADWAKDEGEYVPMVTTWLNQDRWYAKPKAKGTNGHVPGPKPSALVDMPRMTKGVVLE